MSKIRSTGSVAELAFKGFLEDRGIRFQYQPDFLGKPDFLIGRTAVFIDSAFWHGQAGFPQTNKRFWEAKLKGNRQRDARINRILKGEGYKVVRLDEDFAIKLFKSYLPRGARK